MESYESGYRRWSKMGRGKWRDMGVGVGVGVEKKIEKDGGERNREARQRAWEMHCDEGQADGEVWEIEQSGGGGDGEGPETGYSWWGRKKGYERGKAGTIYNKCTIRAGPGVHTAVLLRVEAAALAGLRQRPPPFPPRPLLRRQD